jgi:hypothetical protein
VEITGPTDRKMTINALNSGAKVWLADFEDANTPLWDNMVTGQLNLISALDRTLDFTSEEGKPYQLKPDSEVPCTSSTARGGNWKRAPARTSTCPRSRAIWKPGSGTTRSTWPRTSWASPAARSGPPC